LAKQHFIRLEHHPAKRSYLETSNSHWSFTADPYNSAESTTVKEDPLTVADIEAAAVWDESWDQKVKHVEGQIRDLSEPAAKSAKLKRLKSALGSLAERLSLDLDLLSVESYSKYCLAYAASSETKENAKVAA
jgi:hypothetical protein